MVAASTSETNFRINFFHNCCCFNEAKAPGAGRRLWLVDRLMCLCTEKIVSGLIALGGLGGSLGRMCFTGCALSKGKSLRS